MMWMIRNFKAKDRVITIKKPHETGDERLLDIMLETEFIGLKLRP